MFIETPSFPGCPSFGFTSEPMYSVTKVETAGGRLRRNRNWSRPLHIFRSSVGPRTIADSQAVLNFWHAVGGSGHGFRFRDPNDYKSCMLHQTITPVDQPAVENVDSPSEYQLVKEYTAGALTQQRDILKPILGTIRLADGGVEKAYGSDWTLHPESGKVVLLFTPVGAITWGGEFEVPVCFDETFVLEMMTKGIQSASVVMRELRREDAI